jgi:hypothetical protein
MRIFIIIFLLSGLLIGCAVPDPVAQDARAEIPVSISMTSRDFSPGKPISYILRLDLSTPEGPRPAFYYPCVDSQIMRTHLSKDDAIVPPMPVFSDAGGSPADSLPVYNHGTARFCDERFVRLHAATATEFLIPLNGDNPERLLFSIYDLTPGEYTLMVSYDLSSAANYRAALDALEFDWGNEIAVFGLGGVIRSNKITFSVK